MAKKKHKHSSKKDNNADKLFAFLAVFLSILGFLIAIIAKKDDKYVMYYAKQSLVLFIAWVIVSVLGLVPVVGWIAAPVLYIVIFILWIIAWANALSGKIKPTPLIGQYGESFNL